MDEYLRQHDHGDTDDTSESCPMDMTFHAGSCEYILFKSIRVSSPGGIFAAAIVVFIIAIAYEGLRFFREKLHNDYISQQQISCADIKADLPPPKTIRQLLTHKMHLTQTLMHLIQVTVSYALMLIVMTYNAWLILAIILGATVGYFSFGWIRQRSFDVSENCCH